MKNYVKDNRSGVITELIKHKPEKPLAKGIASLQLINVESGEVDVEVRSENIIMDSVSKNAYNYAYVTSLAQRDGSITNPFNTIHFTSWDEGEKQNTPCMLGVQRGWANRSNEYSGSSTLQGTINKNESRYYFNSEGKYVISMVFDFPTHACNGTFQSILWTYSDVANYRYIPGRGKTWFAPSAISEDIRNYLKYPGYYMNYDHVNEYITFIVQDGFNTSIPANNPYRNSNKGFRFKRYTSELIDHVTYRDMDGNNISLNGATATTFLSNGQTLWLYYHSSSSSSGDRYQAKSYTIERYNNEGILINRHWFNPDSVLNADGIVFTRIGVPHIDPKTGYFTIYGYFKISDDRYDNVTVVYDPLTERVISVVSFNKQLYIPPIVTQPNSVRISAITRGKDICTFTFVHNRDEGGTSSYYGTYYTGDINKIKYLNDFNGGYYSGSNYSMFVGNLDYSLYHGTSGYPFDMAAWRQNDRWGAPTAHTLLAAPVTKTQSHTMKVTYEVIVDDVDLHDFDTFFEN